MFEDTYGMFVHKATGEEDHVVARNCVYYLKKIANDNLLQAPGAASPFGGRGFV